MTRAARILAVFAAVPLVVAVALKAMGEPIRPEDLWWHLGMGRAIAALGAIPVVDIFSFTRKGEPYFDQPWLAQIVLFWTHHAAGLAGLLVVDFGLMLFAEAMAVASAVQRGARLVPALMIQFALAPVAARGWAMRPQALAVPLFAAFVYLLARWRSGARAPVWLLVPLMIVWANVHGSFVLGIVLVALAAAAAAVDSVRQRGDVRVRWGSLGLAAAGCAVAPLMNPRGPDLFWYVASLVRYPTVQMAKEWQALSLSDAEGKYIWAVLAVTALVAIWKRPRLGDLVLIIPFAYLETRALRNGIWLSLVLGPIVAGWFGAGGEGEIRKEVPRPFVIATVVSVLLLCAIPWVKPRVVPRPHGPLVWEARTPVAGVEALARDERRPARLLHGMAYGSYLVFALPSQPVFVDPRLEFYPWSYWNDLGQAGSGRNLDAIFERYRIDGVLAETQGQASLVKALKRRADFDLRYEDEYCAYFARRHR